MFLYLKWLKLANLLLKEYGYKVIPYDLHLDI